MSPRGRARLCAQCDKLVHDLSALRESEARALLAGANGSLCVRYLYDEHGAIWFSTSKLNRAKRAGALTAATVALPLLVQACGGLGPYDGPNDYNPFADAGKETGQSYWLPDSSDSSSPDGGDASIDGPLGDGAPDGGGD